MKKTAQEVNFDGLIGPTHHYAGLSYGNIASMLHNRKPSNPRKAALQGLEKIYFLASLGIKQAILPPLERPDCNLLRQLGFFGTDSEIMLHASRDAPELFYPCCTASSMWCANAGTFTPSTDSLDGRSHFTAANLSTFFHRATEAQATWQLFKKLFHSEEHFAIHPPLPYAAEFNDEGAANHTRFCRSYGTKGVHLFVYGKCSLDSGRQPPVRYPSRQSYEASSAIARIHQLSPGTFCFAQQNPLAIDVGIFHNDVISSGNQNLFLYHEEAFVDTPKVIDQLEQMISSHCGATPLMLPINSSQLSLQDCVRSYLFNSQIVTLPSKKMALIAPRECKENKAASVLLEKLIADPENPITELHFVDLRQSMQNGGGPACLRLRIVLNDLELSMLNPNIFLTFSLYEKLKNWINTFYRDHLEIKDLADPQLLEENHTALDQLTTLLKLGPIYSFQK